MYYNPVIIHTSNATHTKVSSPCYYHFISIADGLTHFMSHVYPLSSNSLVVLFNNVYTVVNICNIIKVMFLKNK